jgi:hypothetical protein
MRDNENRKQGGCKQLYGGAGIKKQLGLKRDRRRVGHSD